jgi:hypothetical protein
MSNRSDLESADILELTSQHQWKTTVVLINNPNGQSPICRQSMYLRYEFEVKRQYYGNLIEEPTSVVQFGLQQCV